MSPSILFADGVLEASVHVGVARVTLGQTGADGKPLACGQLAIPVAQLPAFVRSLQSLLQQFEAKRQQAQQAQQQEPTGQPAADAFRFSG
jgi:TRAP-type C4-dicarboxylate transport system permease small subunit